jgi:glycosyltransferase involved in cell wall biosynthesis
MKSKNKLKIMRILILTTDIWGIGGIERYSRSFCRALALAVPESKRWLVSARPRPDGIADPKLNCHIMLTRGPKMWTARKFWLTVTLPLLALRLRPTHLFALHINLAPLAQWMARMMNTGYSVVVHGIEVWGILSRLKKQSLINAKKVIAVSRFTAEVVHQQHGIPEHQFALLPNIIDLPLTKEKVFPPHLPTLLTVGRIAKKERYKGHEVVLKAMPQVLRQVPDARYVVVGDGDDRPRLERLAHQLGIASSVAFVGQVSDNELVRHYATCDVFVMPSKTVLDPKRPKGEGFGIVYLEAMAHGKPVVGPNYGAPTEFLRHGENALLVDPNNPHEVAEAVVYLLTHPEEARRMGERGRQLVAKEFTMEAMVRRLKALLAELMQ